MKKGYLSEYFEGVGIKTLSAVEVDVDTSNQHEFNGVSNLRRILGSERSEFPTTFLYLSDNMEEPAVEQGFTTWYDARQKAREERGVMRVEYRLYFPTTHVSQMATEGDLLVIARLRDNSLLAIVIEAGSTIERQILWLFGVTEPSGASFLVRDDLETGNDKIEFASGLILGSIGIEVSNQGDMLLEDMLQRFGGIFPTTSEFSRFARSTLPDLTPLDGPDDVLMAWMEREEILFRTLERHLIGEQLSRGFADVDSFISYSLSVQNRRKSRAGLALENHLSAIFDKFRLNYSRTRVTENKSKPDFIFPGIAQYHDPEFAPALLTMLAAKSSLKDRWRQILAEAARISGKHLFTLAPSISEAQTDEMVANQVQLVTPRPLHQTFSSRQRGWLIDLEQFISIVRERQAVALN